MGVQDDIDALKARAQCVRVTLQKSQSTTESLVTIISSFDDRLSTLETALRPTQVKTRAFRKAHENIDGACHEVRSVLQQFEVARQVESKVLQGPKGDLSGFLEACDTLQKNVEYLTLNRSLEASNSALDRARDLFSKGMIRLEEHFKMLLIHYSKPADSSRLLETLPMSGNTVPEAAQNGGGEEVKSLPTNAPLNHNPPALPVLMLPRIVFQLAEMAKRLVAAGLHQQCLKIYRDVRGSNLKKNLRNMGIESLSKDDIGKASWELLQGKVFNWMKHMQIAILLLFPAERALCEQIWFRLDPHREKCFADVANSSVRLLLDFGEATVKNKKTTENITSYLQMYETMRDLQPEIEIVFSGDATSGMREAATGLMNRVGQAAKENLADFEDSVNRDSNKTLVLDGTIHMLTKRVIGYVGSVLKFQNTLNELFLDSTTSDGSSNLASAILRIMTALQNNLEEKAKLYKDVALSHLFLMNNIHHMVRFVGRSEAKIILGDDWVQRQRRVVQQHSVLYQRAAWRVVLQYITKSGNGSSNGDSGNISKSMLKERLKGFSLTFEDLYMRQTQWAVPDSELREAVRLNAQELILSAYRNFTDRHSTILEGNQSIKKHMKYNAEDLEHMLSELFEGKSQNEPRAPGRVQSHYQA